MINDYAIEAAHLNLHINQERQQDLVFSVIGHISGVDPTTNKIKVVIPTWTNDNATYMESGWVPLGTSAAGNQFGIQLLPFGGATVTDPTGKSNAQHGNMPAAEQVLVHVLGKKKGLYVVGVQTFNTIDVPPTGYQDKSMVKAAAGEWLFKQASGSYLYMSNDNTVQLEALTNPAPVLQTDQTPADCSTNVVIGSAAYGQNSNKNNDAVQTSTGTINMIADTRGANQASHSTINIISEQTTPLQDSIPASSTYPSTTDFPGVTSGNIDFSNRLVTEFPNGLTVANSTSAAQIEFPTFASEPDTYGSEYSIEYEDDQLGTVYSIPTIYNGMLHSSAEAIQNFQNTGQYLAMTSIGNENVLGSYEDAVHNRQLLVNGQPYQYGMAQAADPAQPVIQANAAFANININSNPANASQTAQSSVSINAQHTNANNQTQNTATAELIAGPILVGQTGTSTLNLKALSQGAQTDHASFLLEAQAKNQATSTGNIMIDAGSMGTAVLNITVTGMPNTVNINVPNGIVNINSETSNIKSNTVNLGTGTMKRILNDVFAKFFNDHVHVGVSTGGGTSGPPSVAAGPDQESQNAYSS